MKSSIAVRSLSATRLAMSPPLAMSLPLAVSLLLAVGCGELGPVGDDVQPGDGDASPVVADLQPSGGDERAPVDGTAPVEELVAGINDAGFDLWLTQVEDEENLVFSPLSIGHALLMARAAADEPTGSAIDDAFGLPDGPSAHEAWNTLDAALTAAAETAEAMDGSPTPLVTLADRIWPSTTARPDQEWIDLLARYHGAGVQTIDVTRPDASREAVNGWVSDQTNQLIPELLPEGFINGNTVLVLTDAVYFKAQWLLVFGKYGPVEGAFTRLDGSDLDVSYMVERELPGPRGAGDGYVGAEIPYLGGDFSMLLIVPDQGRFDEVRERLGSGLVDEIDRSFTTGPFELRMPKWETTTDIDLLHWLVGLGASPGRYPGIGPEVILDGAVHGADIAVDEIGTEAAAATGLGFEDSGPPEPELVVAAERPFLYLVRHVDTGAVLFAGQVTDPAG